MATWLGYILDDFRFQFAAGARVLDLGCGDGEQLSKLAGQGAWTCGIDVSTAALKSCRAQNLLVVRGTAERLPFAPRAFDGVICKVTLPYTDEHAAVCEIGRVLSPGGTAYVVSHGAGYYLSYVLRPPRFMFAVYGVRALLNTWLWATTGSRLPGFLGDTLYQSRRRLLRSYRAAGLELEREFPSNRFLGFPVFLYDRVRRIGS